MIRTSGEWILLAARTERVRLLSRSARLPITKVAIMRVVYVVFMGYARNAISTTVNRSQANNGRGLRPLRMTSLIIVKSFSGGSGGGKHACNANCFTRRANRTKI